MQQISYFDSFKGNFYCPLAKRDGDWASVPVWNFHRGEAYDGVLTKSGGEKIF